MIAPAGTSPLSAEGPHIGAAGRWVIRVRGVVAVGLIFLALQLIVRPLFMPEGLDRPIAWAAAPAPILAFLATAVVVVLGAAAAPFITGSRRPEIGLLTAATAIAIWAYGGGSIDAWLLLSHPQVGPPTAGPYWTLVVEYLFVLPVLLGAAIAGNLPGRSWQAAVRRTLPRHMSGAPLLRGIAALLLGTIVNLLLVLLLTGPVGETLVGQVYFAVIVSAALGVTAARRLAPSGATLWFWAAPWLAGLLGMLGAALVPDIMIPEEYNHLNSIPAWGLARPLPLQMSAAGAVVALWMMRGAEGSPD